MERSIRSSIDPWLLHVEVYRKLLCRRQELLVVVNFNQLLIEPRLRSIHLIRKSIGRHTNISLVPACLCTFHSNNLWPTPIINPFISTYTVFGDIQHDQQHSMGSTRTRW
jgi:hypothetical protein